MKDLYQAAMGIPTPGFIATAKKEARKPVVRKKTYWISILQSLWDYTSNIRIGKSTNKWKEMDDGNKEREKLNCLDGFIATVKGISV